MVTAVSVMLLALSGCAAENYNEQQGNTYIFDVKVKDKTVTCLSWKYGNAGGVSCDWANAR